MNPHYHHGVPYGGGGGGGIGGGGPGGGGPGGGGGNHPGDHLTSPPHPPPSPPENNNYHGHHPMGGGGHHSNGHSMGPLGHPGNPHDPHSALLAGHHPHLQQHPAFTGGGGSGHPSQQPHHHHHPHLHPHHPINTNNNNNNNNTGPGGGAGGTIKVCQGCGGKIVERFLLHALDRYWHNSCLKCNCCGAMLAEMGSSCFTKGGMILCKQDYMRLYGSSGACSACGQTIPASEFVMRSGPGGSGAGSGGGGGGGPSPQHPGSGPPSTHVFHLKCFACSKCGQPLVSGDRYYMVAANLVCEQDWHKMLKSTATPAVRKGKVGRPRRSRD